jgi:hypothetical protein
MQKAGLQNQNRTAPLSHLNSFVSLVKQEVKTTVVFPGNISWEVEFYFPGASLVTHPIPVRRTGKTAVQQDATF